MNLAVLDACVLYPAALRDLLMWLAAAGAYSPRWTDQIHDEWMRNTRKNNPAVSFAKLERTRKFMEVACPASLVRDYDSLIPKLQLPDPDDRHVLAAAIHSKAAHIVTFNLTDFPAIALEPHGIRATHPDHFLSALLDDDPTLFIQGVRDHRAELKSPPKNAQEYVETIRSGGLNELALKLGPYSETI